MPAGIEQTRVAPREIPPLGSKMNWWGILGLLCMVSSAFLSVGILVEVLEFVVGCLMVESIRKIEWKDFTEAFPAFLVMIGIPFAWSIADGIAFGFISYPALKLLTGRGREASTLVYILGLLFVARYVFL